MVAAGLLAVAARPAVAADPTPSFRYLVTGNGFGFQVFDIAAGAIKQYLERPYRFLRANPTNPDADGLVRRNLAFDTYFGVKAGGTAAWIGGHAPSEVGYVDQSNVIRSVVGVGSVSTESFYFSPFGYDGNAMVMVLRVTNTGSSPVPVSAYAIHNFKLGSAPNPDEPGSSGETIASDATATTETGPGGGTMIYEPIGGADVASCAADAYATVAAGAGLTPLAACSGEDRKPAFAKDLGSLAAGASATWGVAVLFAGDGTPAATRAAWETFAAGRSAAAVLADSLAEFEAWRKPPPPGLSPSETAVWRQSESVLRMSQVRESYQETPRRKNRGMVLASLPPGGWHTQWTRDATYALTAMARSGHWDEAKLGLNFFLDADANRFKSFLGNVDYRISTVRYYGDGQEDSDFSGAPTRNIEIDGWGLVLWAARQYVDASADVDWLNATTAKGDTVYDALKVGVADALAANLESSGIPIADASIWEVHWGNREHFLYTAAAAARGFCDMATLARRAGRMDDIEHYRALSQAAVDAIKGGFIDSHNVLAGSLERLARGSNYRDGSTLETVTWGLVAGDSPIGKATLASMSFLQTPAGGYKRLEGSQDQYDTDEWILIDLRASGAFRRNGNVAKADALLGTVSAQAAVNNNLLPELYNTRSASGQIGAYSGSIPMVGYGAGAYEMTLLDRAGLVEPQDCGKLDVGEPPAPDGTDGTSDGGPDGRTGVACACAGGPGSPSTAVILAVVGLVVLRRRRTGSAA